MDWLWLGARSVGKGRVGSGRPKVFCFSSCLCSPTAKPTHHTGNEFHRNHKKQKFFFSFVFALAFKGQVAQSYWFGGHTHAQKWWVRRHSATICFFLCTLFWHALLSQLSVQMYAVIPPSSYEMLYMQACFFFFCHLMPSFPSSWL